MKILIISPGGMSNLDGGASNRIYNLTTNLKDYNNLIVLEPSHFSAENVKIDEDIEIHHYFGEINTRSFAMFCDINPFFIIKLIKLISKENLDIVHVEFPWGVPITKLICKLYNKKVKVVYDSHNYQAGLQNDLKNYYKNQDNSFNMLVSSMSSFYTKFIEKHAVEMSDKVLCVSEKDKNLFTKNYGIDSHKIIVVPNGIDLKKVRTAKREKRKYNLDTNKFSIVFHGSCAYPPNAKAIKLIENEIAPKFKNFENIEFIIAGKANDCSKFSNIKSNIKFLGFVKDIFGLLKSSDIAIVPLCDGGGTKLKVLDYLGAGLPIVTTKKGIEGIEIKNGEHAIVVDTVNDEFIKAIMDLTENKDKREYIASNAYNLAEEKYDWVKIVKILNSFYNNFKERKLK